MRFRVGITPDFHTDAEGRFERGLADGLRDAPEIEVGTMPPQPGKLATPDALDQFDAIFSLALKIAPESLRGVERLALVARWGVGYDMIDVDALTSAGVALAITPKAVRRPVAEAIFTFIFALGKNLVALDRMTRRGEWRGSMDRLSRNFDTQVLGSIGCGNIGREMFRMARAFGFRRLLACDPYLQPDAVADRGIELVDMDTVLRESDFVTVNTFLNASTNGLIGERELKLMKPTAYLINTARGPIVQEEALIRAREENGSQAPAPTSSSRSRLAPTTLSSASIMCWLLRTLSLGPTISCTGMRSRRARICWRSRAVKCLRES